MIFLTCHVLLYYLLQGCLVTSGKGFRLGVFDQVDFSIDYIDPYSKDKTVIIGYSGGNDDRYIHITTYKISLHMYVYIYGV